MLIEVKYRNLAKPTVSRSLRSFVEAYQPTQAIIITKDLVATTTVATCQIHFIPIQQFSKFTNKIQEYFSGA